jgi:hypothetical protein
VPTAGQVVHVDPGHTVTIAGTSAVAYTIAVHGTLRFDPQVDTRLMVTNLMVMGDHGMPSMTQVGHLEMGTAANPIAVGRTADIVIANSPLGSGVADPDQFGTGIINFGKFTMHGAAMSTTFLRLAVEPRAGHTTVTLSEPVSGWRPGDRLVIPDTRHMKESETTSGGWMNAQNQWEELTVQSLSADARTVTLTAALRFDHLGARDLNGVLAFLPHVGNLSRNASIRSQSATGTRGHFISVHTADTDIRYTLFRDLGRTKYTPLNTTTNVIGRYPIHMHHNRGPLPTPASGYQFTLVGNAVDGGSVETQFKWGIAVHNSHYGLIQDNVVYNYNGSSIVTEDGSESFNLFDHNFALRGIGEPNNGVDEARSAMGTEGAGFWFRGPNNYVRNNVAANFQNPTTEAAYGFVYQFIRLGNVAMPNFKGADPAVAGQFTTRNGNNLPFLQFENNEAYGAMQGGFTYWWVNSLDPQPYANAQESVVKDLKIWHVYNKAVYHYPSQKITFDGLIIRGNFSSASRCCGNGIYGADYSTKGIIIRNSDIQGMDEGIAFPEAGFGPEPNLTVEATYLRNDNNMQIPTNGSVNGCWMQNKLVVITNTRFEAPPGRSLNNIAMVRDVGYAPECLSKLDEARVYAYNGVATDNFQIYHTNTSVLPRPPGSCTPTTRAGINGLLCPIAALGPVPPTVTASASPASITAGQSAALTWATTNATSVSINQGIGSVATSGTRSVSPTVSTTYILTATNSTGTAAASVTVTVGATEPPPPPPSGTPVIVGSQIAGAFGDATGHSAQSHLVYAANSGVWWLFTLTSAADGQGGSNHVVKSYRSSGSDLATATWTPGPDSPGASVAAGFSPNGSMGSGRALGVAYINNNPTDVLHAEVNMSYDGQDAVTGHIRAVLTGTSITWASWNYSVEPSATWARPGTSVVGVSTGKYIHSAGPNLQQQIDANARKSANADTGATWTSGFSGVSVIDNSMINQVNSLAFAPLANNLMLAVYDNGGGQSCGYNCTPPGSATEPGLTNLGYKRSNANGSWPGVPIGSQAPGDGSVFASAALINQNDWALVPASATSIFAFRAKAAGNGIDGASYNAATNTWSAMPVAPPAFGAGQAFKAGAGLFGATDGTRLWLFYVNTDAANSVLYAQFDGSSWTPWAAVPGTATGSQNRNYIAGSPMVGNQQVGLIWTEGNGPYTVAATSFAVSAAPPPMPTVTLVASPASIVLGSTASLVWSSANATSVSIDQGVGAVATAGTKTVSPTATIVYTITAANAAGSATATAVVTVSAPPPPPPLPTATLSVAPAVITSGDTATLTWSTSNATSVTIDHGVGSVTASGTTSVAPGVTTTYTLTATSAAGSATATATVTVATDPQGPPFANVGLTAGWATFGQAVPQGVATGGLAVGTLVTQTDVKNRWPDGSIRFAVVTVLVPATGAYPLSATSAAGGSLTPAPVDASVSLTIGAAAYTATLPAAASADLWLSGPLVREDRQVVAPVSGDGTAHPFLRVNFDRRRFTDGQARVDVSVENLLDRSGATTVTYDAVIVVNGQAVFTKAAVQHYYLTRWRKIFQVGPTSPAEVTPDLAPYYDTRALPPYLPLVTNQVSAPTGSSFDILQPGALIANMPGHGGRPELAPYPDWTARYLVHRDATQRDFVLANGDLSGSWPIHVREAEDGAASGVGAERYVSLDQRPSIWFDGRAQGTGVDYVHGTPLPIREYGSTTPGPGQSPLIPDNAHQPSLAYVPYLLTGDRYYAEEMAFWANYSMLRTYNADGVRSSQGILQSNEVRGFGWALRNMVDAAAYYPDTSPMKAYLSQKVTNNLRWLDAYANSQDPNTNPFTVLWLNKRPEGPEYRGLWEENYLAYAIDRAWQQGFSGGLAHRDAIARFQVRLFNSEPAYPRSAAAPNVVGVGTPTASGFIFHQTMGDIWTATQGQTRPFTGYYGPEARLNLMIGVESGWSGAQDAYDYLWPFLAVQPAWGSVPDLGERAGWALDFYPGSQPPPPPPPAVPAALVSPAPGAVFTATSQTFAWSAGTGVTAYRLDVGTTAGGSNLFAGVASANLSATVVGLPDNGSAIWVRLSSQINGAWQPVDYTFTAMTAPPPPPPPPADGIAVSQTITANGTGTLTTGALGASAAGDILVAFAASSGPQASRQALTVTGGGLTWKRALRANIQAGSSEIWWTKLVAPLTGVRVTSTPSRAGFDQSLTVVAFKGAKGVGSVVQANAMDEAPHIVLTTTRAGSLVYAVGNDWDGAVARTLGAGQVMVHEWVDSRINDTFWVQTFTSKVPYAGTTVELNATQPRLNRWNLAAIEIVK